MYLISAHLRLIGCLMFVSGLLKEAYESVGRALALFSSVCGVLHEDVCLCLRLLGRLSYNLGEYADVKTNDISFLLCTFYMKM